MSELKIVCISDTHNKLGNVDIPEGDVLVIAGDITGRGSIAELHMFLSDLNKKGRLWKDIVLVAGNHDFCFEDSRLAKTIVSDAGILYLEDQDAVVQGVKFYGSPWQPRFFDWAFNADRGAPLARIWAKIPDDTQVLITHGPPHGVLDIVPSGGASVGCEALQNRLNQLASLKLHVFGHIHHSYGTLLRAGVTFVNASICTEQYQPKNKPIVVVLSV